MSSDLTPHADLTEEQYQSLTKATEDWVLNLLLGSPDCDEDEENGDWDGDDEFACPDYYKAPCGLRVFDVTDAFDLNFNLGCVLKYVIRAGKKPNEPAKKDLHKAIDCIRQELTRLHEQEEADE